MTPGLKFLVTTTCAFVILACLKAAAIFVTPLLLAVFIATLAAAPVAWLVERRVAPWLAITIVLLAIVVLVATRGAVVVESAQTLFSKQDEYVARLSELLARWAPTLSTLALTTSLELDKVLNASTLWELASQTLTGISNVITNGFLILLVFVLILVEMSALTQKVRTLLHDANTNYAWIDSFASNINRYIVIKTLHSLATGILIALGLWLIGVDFPVLWGLLAFLLNFIPNIGSVIAALPVVLLALVQLGPSYALATIGLFLFVNVLIGNIVEPRFMGAKLGLSTLVVFLSLIFWGYMFGAVGMLLSVPITMTIKIAAEASPNTRWLSRLLGNEPTPVAA